MIPQHPHRYALALAGEVAAEALTTADRGRLLWTLYGGGMSVEEIAAHTRSTPYTVERILHRIARSGTPAPRATIAARWAKEQPA